MGSGSYYKYLDGFAVTLQVELGLTTPNTFDSMVIGEIT